jgi:hypothetical protein
MLLRFLPLFIAGGCEPKFYANHKMQVVIIITMPIVVYGAMQELQHQGIGSGDQTTNRFFTQATNEMKSPQRNNFGWQFHHGYLVHVFDKDMHCDFSSMSSDKPIRNECYMGEDYNGTTWYCLVSKPIIQEAIEIFKWTKANMRGMRRRKNDMDTEASPATSALAVANNELITTLCALMNSL